MGPAGTLWLKRTLAMIVHWTACTTLFFFFFLVLFARAQVDMGVYMDLARALGLRYTLVMIILFTIYNIGALGGNLWLSAWTDDPELTNTTALPADSPRRGQLNDFYLGIYAALGVAQSEYNACKDRADFSCDCHLSQCVSLISSVIVTYCSKLS